MSTYTETSSEFYLPRLAACALEFDVRQSSQDGADADESIVGNTYVLRLCKTATDPVALSKSIEAESHVLRFEFSAEEMTIEADDYVGTVWLEPDHKPLHPINFVVPVRDVAGGNA